MAGCALFGAPAIADDTVVLPQGTYGTGDSANYYKWKTDATTGNTTLVETTEVADITTRYDSVYSYIDKSITNTYVAAGAAVNNPTSEEQLTADFVNNTSSGTNRGHGGAVLIDQVTNYTVTGDFIGNSTSGSDAAYGGAIYFNCGSVDKIVGDFIANKAYTTGNSSREGAKGGAISTYYHGRSINTITADFIGNSAQGSSVYGGAIYNDYYYKLGNITGDFIGNSAIGSSASGGAIYNVSNATITSISGDFVKNYVNGGSPSYGGAISNVSSAKIDSITGTFTGNYVKRSHYAFGGAIYNASSAKIGTINANFTNNYLEGSSSASGGAIYNFNSTIDSITGDFISNNAIGSSAFGGAIYNVSNATITSISGDFVNNYVNGGSPSYGGAIYNSGSITIENSSFLNNYAKSESGTARGGAIWSSKDLNIIAKDDYTSVISGNYTESAGVKDDNAIFLDNASLTLNMANGGKFLLNDNITTVSSRRPASEFYSDNGVSNFEEYVSAQGFNGDPVETFENMLAMEGVTPDQLAQQEGFENIEALASAMGYNTVEDLVKNELGIYGDTAEEQFLNSFGYASESEFIASKGYGLHLVKIQGDDINNTVFYMYNDIKGSSVNIGNTTINTINNQVHNYNFHSLNLTADTNMVVDVDLANKTMDRFTASEYGSHSGNLNVVGMNLLSDAVDPTTKILFAEKGLKDNVTTTVSEVAYTPIYKYNVSYDKSGEEGYFVFTRGAGSAIQNGSSFNPAVLGGSTSATVGAIGTVNQTFNHAFGNADTFMNIPYLERLSMKNRNRYALGNAIEKGRFSPLYQPSDEEASVWVKPYATFETVGLKNGPKVHNNTYGTLVGFDTEMQSLKHGWDRVITGYIGYNGASQRYSGVDSTQNGGLIGGTVTMYKGNFFNATTVSVGANVAQNQTMYGKDDFAMLLSGVGNKTGYNFEFKEGKLILQPSMLMSYTFVNTFDYTNAAGVRIDNKPLHALQLAPGVKVIGNLKNGWQPYASVSMVWNLMGESDATANGVKLPEMSIKPYVQYGVGVQKRIKDHFTAYGQAMIQNGGRNGISLTGGFRWALGKNKDQKVEKVRNDKVSYTSGKKIIKQMTPEQRMALGGGKYMNTSRTAKSGSLRQY